jgi:hypothetical protein
MLDTEARGGVLRDRAADYVRIALEGITTDYPVMPLFVATGPGPYRTHREMHPAFYGCFDWHSCVEMTWAVVRLLRAFPDDVPADQARATLNELLTPEHIAAEVAFFSDPNHRSIERPYGWGWLLTLQQELRGWDDPDAAHWAEAVQPLADLLAGNLAAWLPKLTYPQRTGVHPNSAFGLSRSYDFAKRLADQGDDALLRAIDTAARRWFLDDVDYPAQYEPSGADFLSPALTEAELMSRLLPAGEFIAWLDRFLPGIAAGQPTALFQPAIVSDTADGQIAHLHGLNLSRAWAFLALADHLPEGDARITPLRAAAERHRQASLSAVAGRGYMVEHWLAAYATLLLSQPG